MFINLGALAPLHPRYKIASDALYCKKWVVSPNIVQRAVVNIHGSHCSQLKRSFHSSKRTFVHDSLLILIAGYVRQGSLFPQTYSITS